MPKIAKLERHAYAPELNRLHLTNGLTVPVPGCTTIAQARKAAWPRPSPGIVATITFTREGRTVQTYGGYILARASALLFARDLAKTRHAGGRLLDGTDLPPATYRVTTRLTA